MLRGAVLTRDVPSELLARSRVNSMRGSYEMIAPAAQGHDGQVVSDRTTIRPGDDARDRRLRRYHGRSVERGEGRTKLVATELSPVAITLLMETVGVEVQTVPRGKLDREFIERRVGHEPHRG